MIQVASCEQASIKTKKETDSKPPEQNNASFKRKTLEFGFDRHLEHMVSNQGMQGGLPVFLLVNSSLSRFLCKMTALQSLSFHISPTGNIKNRSYLDRI